MSGEWPHRPDPTNPATCGECCDFTLPALRRGDSRVPWPCPSQQYLETERTARLAAEGERDRYRDCALHDHTGPCVVEDRAALTGAKE